MAEKGGFFRKRKALPYHTVQQSDFFNQPQSLRRLLVTRFYHKSEAESVSSLYKTGAQAARAGIYSAGSAVYDCLYLLNIRLIGSVAASVGVRYLDAEGHALAADFTFCHFIAPTSLKYSII